MLTRQKIAFYTVIKKEVSRFLRLWLQTILPPFVTMSLYFLIFGQLVGSRVGPIHDQPYILFIAPGIIMLSMLTNTYANVSSSFFIEKFVRSVEEMIYAPVYTISIVIGFMVAGALRGLLVGLGVYFIAHAFTHVPIMHPWLALGIAVLSTMCMAGLGLVNALYANHFDGINVIPTFVLTPLIYLGGVFFPIVMLPHIWQVISWYNPLAYVISAFRFALLGHAVVDLTAVLALSFVLLIAVISFCVRKINRLDGVIIK